MTSKDVGYGPLREAYFGIMDRFSISYPERGLSTREVGDILTDFYSKYKQLTIAELYEETLKPDFEPHGANRILAYTMLNNEKVRVPEEVEMTEAEKLLEVLRKRKEIFWKEYIECVSEIMKVEAQIESEKKEWGKQDFIRELEARYGSQIFDTTDM